MASEFSFFSLLCCPASRSELTFHQFSNGDPKILDGVLVSSDRRHVYPVLHGVPVMLPKSIPSDFADAYQSKFKDIGIDPDPFIRAASGNWSFSNQWSLFQELEVESTWGWSTDDRVAMFFQETQTTPDALSQSAVLDAGCGNGLLTEALGKYAKLMVGVDFSDSVFANAARNRSQNVYFVKGDLQRPPFKDEVFNVVVSNGVLHHTPDTRRSFEALSSVVAKNGVYYVWLYRLSKYGNVFRRGLRGIVQNLRKIIAPMPGFVRTPLVYSFAGGLKLWNRLNGEAGRYTYSELVITAHDSLTPKYRTLHTPTEVAEWYFECGFAPPVLTHWDNRTGFGIAAKKEPQQSTPGMNHGQPPRTAKRYGL